MWALDGYLCSSWRMVVYAFVEPMNWGVKRLLYREIRRRISSSFSLPKGGISIRLATGSTTKTGI